LSAILPSRPFPVPQHVPASGHACPSGQTVLLLSCAAAEKAKHPAIAIAIIVLFIRLVVFEVFTVSFFNAYIYNDNLRAKRFISRKTIKYLKNHNGETASCFSIGKFSRNFYFCKSKNHPIFCFSKSKIVSLYKIITAMDELNVDILIDLYHRKLTRTKSLFYRYLYNRINWDARLIAIRGARGVGKTTMLLQHIRDNFPNPDEALYVSLDNLWFSNHTLTQLAQYADSHGIRSLYLDEVHRYAGWLDEIKAIYDFFPDIKIVYTSSSMLKVDHSRTDLSRRQTVYHLAGLSLREYLDLESVGKFAAYSLEQILSDHTKIALDITSKVTILPYFEKYFKRGYYPFYLDSGDDYMFRLREVVETVVDVDIPAVEDVSFATLGKIKNLLMVLASAVPTVPKLSVLFSQIEVQRDLGLKILNLLDRGDLLMLLSTKPKNYKNLTIPEKILINNPNILYALSDSGNIGSARESFFFNQLRETGADINLADKGDFLVNGKYTFEVGGSTKTFSQIADIPNSYLAVDGIETGHGSRIPLWLFGFLY